MTTEQITAAMAIIITQVSTVLEQVNVFPINLVVGVFVAYIAINLISSIITIFSYFNITKKQRIRNGKSWSIDQYRTEQLKQGGYFTKK